MLQIALAIGGVGLFLLGMTLLTEGLRGLAGSSFRRLLAKFTQNPATGALTGALATAFVQSSSATTVAAVGFVSAGLISFPNALGIIFGANIGTTITGWIVAIIGFKLNLSAVFQPLILIGVLLRIFGKQKLRNVAWAITGFGLLFVGIETLQAGLAAWEGSVLPSLFPEDTLFGRLQLVLLGMAVTLVTQSSSAGVAAALVALNTDAITFGQAAAMVIGMDVGTTFTTALATLGGSTATRRTGYAHVIYNIMTAVMALALLTPYSSFAGSFFDLNNQSDAQIALVGFHSMFNTVGVLLILGLTQRFALLMESIVPESGPTLTKGLDDKLLVDPDAATDAALGSARDIAKFMFSVLTARLSVTSTVSYDENALVQVQSALDRLRQFVEQIRHLEKNPQAQQRFVSVVHALDHLNRLFLRCGQAQRIHMLQSDARLKVLASELAESISTDFTDADLQKSERRFDYLHDHFREARRSYRSELIENVSIGVAQIETVPQKLDSVRWLHRVSYHIWRILFHLRQVSSHAPEISTSNELVIELEND